MVAKGSSNKLLKNMLLKRIGEKKVTSNTDICKYLYIIYTYNKKLNIEDQSHL